MDMSKMVVDRQKLATEVIAASRAHKSKAGSGVAKLLGCDFGSAAEHLMDASADKLEKITMTMVAAVEGHISKLDSGASLSAERVKAVEAYDKVFSKTAGLISAMLRIAGEEDLAERFRPVKNKPGRITNPDAQTG
jgi:hypothetical protein